MNDTTETNERSVSDEIKDTVIADGGIFRINAGHVCFTFFEKPPVETKGGMLIAEGKEETYDRPAFGVIAACGKYVERNTGGTVWDVKDWPLPPGTLILQMYPNPSYINLPGNRFYFIRADQIVAHYLPGQWPAWALKVAEDMKKHPSPFEHTVLCDPDKHRKLLEEKSKADAKRNRERMDSTAEQRYRETVNGR